MLGKECKSDANSTRELKFGNLDPDRQLIAPLPNGNVMC